jgi:hypothetical protein
MEVSGQLHAPAALPLEKEPPVPTEYEAGWAPDAVGKNKFRVPHIYAHNPAARFKNTDYTRLHIAVVRRRGVFTR